MTEFSTPAPGSPLCKAANIQKFFPGNNKLEVLKKVDIELTTGELIAVVGSSGTGKTTLLHILGTLEKPTGGSLHFQNTDVTTLDDTALSRFRNKVIGFVFQFHHLLPEFSALENIMLPGLIAGRPRNELLTDARELLSQVGLSNRMQHKVGELSGGEQQRVALARAIIMRPALLLADEPTGNLDPKTGRRVFDLIREMNAAYSLTTVMVTHNHELAAEMDRCLTLADGELH